MQPTPTAGTGRHAALAVAITFPLAFFLLAANIDLSERLSAWLADHEQWQFDELALTLALLASALAWYAQRRSRAARRAQACIAELLAHNRELSQRLIRAQEAERCALARELHDEVGQNCSAIRAEASYILRAQPGEHAAVRDCAIRIGAGSENLHALVRRMLCRLRPPALDSLGLEPALQELCEHWQQQHRIDCSFDARGLPEQLDDATAIAIYRLVQEALTNVARHAGADRVRITLQCAGHGTTIALSIEDNGCGMRAPAGPRAGFGVSGMQERVAGLRGTIAWLDARARGLRIEVELPLAGLPS